MIAVGSFVFMVAFPRPALTCFVSFQTQDTVLTDLTPREIVSELDRFIIGQDDAKRAVAVALRNRWRRK